MSHLARKILLMLIAGILSLGFVSCRENEGAMTTRGAEEGIGEEGVGEEGIGEEGIGEEGVGEEGVGEEGEE